MLLELKYMNIIGVFSMNTIGALSHLFWNIPNDFPQWQWQLKVQKQHWTGGSTAPSINTWQEAKNGLQLSMREIWNCVANAFNQCFGTFFYLHQTAYKIACMHSAAGRKVLVPWSAYMPFELILNPSVTEPDSSVLKSQSLFLYSSTNQKWIQGFNCKIFRVEKLSLECVWHMAPPAYTALPFTLKGFGLKHNA